MQIILQCAVIKILSLHSKYAQHPNVEAKFLTGTTALMGMNLGFAKKRITV